MCQTFIDALPIDGACIVAFDEGGRQSSISASDPTAARIDQLHYMLGEGPHWDVLRTARPVLVPDIRGTQQWPIFTHSLGELPVGGIFAFPIQLGIVMVGAVDLHTTLVGELDAATVARARAMANDVALDVVRLALESSSRVIVAELPLTTGMRREVHQATGMILVQLDTTGSVAFARLRAHAFATDRSVQDVAHDVVSRAIDFSDLY